MAERIAIENQLARIGEIVEFLELSADPNARMIGKELLECVMTMHSSAIERILELITEAGEPGEAIIRKCGRDEAVSGLLLLYGLHPESMSTRVMRALQNSHKLLDRHDATAELVSITEDGAVTVRLEVKSRGCGAASLPDELKASIQDAAPDASAIFLEEYGASVNGAGFVPVAQLEHSASHAISTDVSAAENRPGSAD